MSYARILRIAAGGLAMGHPASAADPGAAESRPDPKNRPNILFIMVDDHGPGLHDVLEEGRVQTPNIRRLAERGTWFKRGFAAAPACGPSRTAILTGVHPARSGSYYNMQAYRRDPDAWIGGVETLPGRFLRGGYLVAGYGKIGHNTFLEDDIKDYSPGYYKMFNRPADITHTEHDLIPHLLPGTYTEMLPGSTWWSFGQLPDDWDRGDPAKLQQDTEFANMAIGFLGEAHERPFFLTVGFWRPHLAWFVPKRYYDMHPLESIELPEGYKEGDLDDVPGPARWLATHRGEHATIVDAGLWKKALQAYYASISYIDEQIGRVLDALESSPYNDNTIVVFAGDNGFHTGEKDHWSKFYLSDLANGVPFAISVPEKPRQVVGSPVGLIDIYPTLLSLAGLDPPEAHALDGLDLSPLLAGGSLSRGAPVVSTYGRGNHSVRDDRFRYNRYRNGDEELYDHAKDPHEWINLAADPSLADEVTRLRKFLPPEDAPDIALQQPDSNAWQDVAFEEVEGR